MAGVIGEGVWVVDVGFVKVVVRLLGPVGGLEGVVLAVVLKRWDRG